SCLILFSRQLKYIGKQGDVRFFMRTIPYGFADACGIASSENHPSKFPRKLAWEVEERARGKHANPKELCENPNIYYRTVKKRTKKEPDVRLFSTIIRLSFQ